MCDKSSSFSLPSGSVRGDWRIGGLALTTAAKELQPVAVDAEAGFAGEALRDRGQRALPELDDQATATTDELMAVAEAGRGVAVAAIVEVHADDQPKVGEELKGAIDRGQAHTGLEGMHPVLNLDRGQVMRALVQGVQHGEALPR